MNQLKRTPLYDAHVAAGATMVDFGGWEMPIQYPDGILAEHLYDRRHCGIFDVSHMGRLLIQGPERVAFLQKVLSSDVAQLPVGRAQYCMIPTETGGAVDDAYLYRYEEDRYMLVVNASNTQKDLDHLSRYLPDYRCTVTDITSRLSSIAVQGPDSPRVLGALWGELPITGPRRNDLGRVETEGRTIWSSRTGYTGDPLGWELFIDASQANWLWQRLIQLGAKPVGLGARDTLRLEAGLPLYGHELGTDPAGEEIPIFAVSLARFAVRFPAEKGDFVGRRALELQAKEGTPKVVLPVALMDRGVMRGGMEVYHNGRPAGWVTSGTMVPYYQFDREGAILDTTGKRAIGFAYLDRQVKTGDLVEIDVRGKRLRAKIVPRHMAQDQPPYGRAVTIQ